jgi:glutaredoxin 3
MKDITVYTTEPCSFCVRVKELLDQRGLRYTEVNLSKDPAGRTELAQRTGMLSFPQVVVGERVVGGLREIVQADQSGRLEELLAA